MGKKRQIKFKNKTFLGYEALCSFWDKSSTK